MQFILLWLILSVGTCTAADRPTVFVSIVPQKLFVQQISKDLVEVEVMVQPGASPHTYEPKPSQMAKLSSCAAYFAIGVPFETAWLGRISAVNPAMTIIRTDQGIEKIAMARHFDEGDAADGHPAEAADQSGLHGHPLADPHIWLSPTLVKKQAAAILAGLIAILPEKSTELEGNYQAFLARIDALDAEVRGALQDKKGMRFMVFHPSWGYFARDYGLEQVPIEIEGKAPKPAELQRLISFARNDHIHVIFAQPQFSAKSAKVVAAEIEGEVVIIDPLAEDWFANLRQVTEKLKAAAK